MLNTFFPFNLFNKTLALYLGDYSILDDGKDQKKHKID